MPKARIIDGVSKDKARKEPSFLGLLLAEDLNRIFSEIISDKELLTKCYCPTRSRNFDESFIKSIATGFPNALLCTNSISPDEFLLENLPKSTNKNTYLIINDVGSGKTTYIHHFFRITLAELNLDNIIDAIIIDMRDLGAEEKITYESLENFVHSKIYSYLNENYVNISQPNIEIGEMLFSKELIPFAALIEIKKIQGDAEYRDYIFNKVDKFIEDKRLFNCARIRYLLDGFSDNQDYGRNIFVVLDNVDHYDQKTQETLFGLSVKIQNELGVCIIMSARDYTMPSIFRHHALCAFAPRFLHLALPNTKLLIQKRVNYIFKSDVLENIFQTSGKDEFMIRSHNKSFKVSKKYLRQQISNIMYGMITNREIIEHLEYLSDYDIRSMLEMIRVALSSGYLLPVEWDRPERIRKRDFLRALMCGNNPYYIPNDPNTKIINLFDNNEPTYCGNNLIRLRTLQVVQMYGDKSKIKDILDFMSSICYEKERVRRVLNELIKTDLIETTHQVGITADDDGELLKLTNSGHFYLTRFIYSDVYLEEVKNGTYMDADIIEEINNLLHMGKNTREAKVNRIAFRLNATRLFLEYLIKEEKKEEALIRKRQSNKSLQNYGEVSDLITCIRDNFKEAALNIISSNVKSKHYT
ncbi:MAG: hypothetical protein ACOWWR_08735 [Eubacteriales bacterium]